MAIFQWAFSIKVAAHGDCALGHLTLEDDGGRACVWAYVERRTRPRSWCGLKGRCDYHWSLLGTIKHCKEWDFNGINHLPTGVGSIPSTVVGWYCDKIWWYNHRCPKFPLVGWWIEGVVQTPFTTGNWWYMVGPSHRPKPIFTKRTLLLWIHELQGGAPVRERVQLMNIIPIKRRLW